ncbi:DUF4183 domain-containing protein [Sedimentibacter hydroxybenzoicus DSM 7310]|uniref:DUF4183 domain-containing protein n=1 Tax=Sedimentibacter hydroxybenzoicus DSM 7310 TaxID=1123245 RepID=A0A974BKH5_SEDHY|nr:DUF4183 domain-containing protein [Sedimentibacter hydroxybenzoicus]NYB74970.1 DUF4183 domain-containing protein [Sedimentibacter hydroxybenzoicus DSM 7310]
MAAQLFKLAIDATTSTDVDINPAIEKYFYLLEEVDRTDDELVIPATKFIDDNGNIMTGNLTTAAENNGYYLLFINGVLQQSSLYTVSVDGSQVTVNDAETIPVQSPITLIVTNFAPISDSDTTVIT